MMRCIISSASHARAPRGRATCGKFNRDTQVERFRTLAGKSFYCDASILVDQKKIVGPSDVDLLAALSTRDQIRIVERLERAPARQTELVGELGLQSGSVSRWLAEFQALSVVSRGGEKRNVYALVEPAATAELLDAAARLAERLSQVRLNDAEAQLEADKRRLEQRRGESRRGG
jgi:hypothetical protein